MISKIRLSVFCAIAIFTAQPVWAESVYTCPDISQARQVGDCSSEEELIRMFASACKISANKATCSSGNQ